MEGLYRRVAHHGTDTGLQEVTSVVFVYLDDDMKIAQLIDRWDGEEHSTRWDFFSFRTLVAKALSWTTRVPEELRRRHV